MKKRYVLLLIMLCTLISMSVIGCGKQQSAVTLNQSKEDNQPYWNIFSRYIAKSESGYYYIDKADIEQKRICYLDNETKSSIPLCAKAECSHTDEKCNAYLEKNYNAQQIYYYNGMIYVIYNDDTDGLSYLVQITPDGTSRERLFEIGPISVAYCLTFNNGSVYIYQRQGGVSGYDESTAVLRRRSLDGKEDENAYEYTGYGAVIHAVKSYGGKIFFLVEEDRRESTEKYSDRIYTRKGVFVYDCTTKKTESVCEGDITDYTIDESNGMLYYYVFNEGLYKRKLSETNAERIYEMVDGETNICQISFDGKYLYMSNEQYYVYFFKRIGTYLYVMDTDGKELNKISTPGIYSTSFGDSQNVFAGKSDFGGGVYKYIEKKDILTAKEWKDIK